MTATQLLERLATSMLATAFPDVAHSPQGVEMMDPLVKAHELNHEDVDNFALDDDDVCGPLPATRLVDLPVVMLEHVCSFLDHGSLHAVENTSVAMNNVTKQSDLWMDLALQSLVVGDSNTRMHSWKQMLCLSSGLCKDDKSLIKGLKAYSSADRPSETPQNTLKPSRCWREMNRYKHRESLTSLQEFYDVPTFVMTLGERIQRRCGCSSGNSCYWSSSASPSQNATDYIDYVLDGPCVISSVQILPYRVFWHPGSPTYGPRQMMVEFYERSLDAGHVDKPRGEMIATPSEVAPFYQSPVFSVSNDMELQEFQLPMRVWSSGTTVMRVRLLGRHQAQTFELPLWMQRTDEDRLPKYYCCVSYVNAVGLSRETLLSPNEVIPSRKRMKLEMESAGVHSSLADIMTACFETMMEQRRRIQLLGSPSS